jgi:thymidine phosphorylase
MKHAADARALAETMVELGVDAGVRTRALLTAMDVPLGRTAGNALEVRESVEVLAGGGPADVVELTVLLAREMLDMAGIDADPEDALRDGRAMDVWRAMIAAQGGDPDAPLPTAPHTHVVTAERAGWLTRLDAYDIGVAAWRLGAGRARKEDPVSAVAGVEWHVAPGEQVRTGQALLTLHTDDQTRLPSAIDAAREAVRIEGDPAGPRPASSRFPLLIDRVE